MSKGENKESRPRRGGGDVKRRQRDAASLTSEKSSVAALLDEVFPVPLAKSHDDDDQVLTETGLLDSHLLWLERKSALGERTAEISHEVRNALVSFKTFLNLLPERQNDAEFMGPYRESVAEDLLRIDRLLEAVLHHAQPGFTDPASGPETTNPELAIQAVVQLLGRAASLRGVELIATCEASFVSMPRDELQQVLLNLTLNAVEATPEGGRVVIRSQPIANPDAEFVEIHIDDEGQGIAQEDRERIFTAFQSARGDRPGGLGLAICRGLIEATGGEIRVGQSKSGGARLIVRVPNAKLK